MGNNISSTSGDALDFNLDLVKKDPDATPPVTPVKHASSVHTSRSAEKLNKSIPLSLTELSPRKAQGKAPSPKVINVLTSNFFALCVYWKKI